MRRLPLVVVAMVMLGAGASTASSADTTTTTSPTTTTTTTAVHHRRVAALTGLPDPTALTKRRSALTIKIDNTPQAHPQYGVNEADVVYEEIVEGGITRLAAIFNSNLPTKVGPVRSVRRTDREIVFPIGGIFAFSGGAAYAIDSIETAPVKLIDQSSAGAAMFRDPTRPPPHNLFANAVLLMKEGGKVHTPPALFTYVAQSAPAVGAPVGSFTVPEILPATAPQAATARNRRKQLRFTANRRLPLDGLTSNSLQFGLLIGPCFLGTHDTATISDRIGLL